MKRRKKKGTERLFTQLHKNTKIFRKTEDIGSSSKASKLPENSLLKKRCDLPSRQHKQRMFLYFNGSLLISACEGLFSLSHILTIKDFKYISFSTITPQYCNTEIVMQVLKFLSSQFLTKFLQKEEHWNLIIIFSVTISRIRRN